MGNCCSEPSRRTTSLDTTDIELQETARQPAQANTTRAEANQPMQRSPGDSAVSDNVLHDTVAENEGTLDLDPLQLHYARVVARTAMIRATVAETQRLLADPEGISPVESDRPALPNIKDCLADREAMFKRLRNRPEVPKESGGGETEDSTSDNRLSSTIGQQQTENR